LIQIIKGVGTVQQTIWWTNNWANNKQKNHISTFQTKIHSSN